MDIKKLFLGGIAGGIAFFLLGWVIYGMLLMNFMTSHPGVAGNIQKTEPDFLYLIIGNLAMGFLFAYVFIKAGVNSMANGLVTGGIMGLLMSVGFNCVMYATTTSTSKTAMAADVGGFVVMTAIGGAIVGMVLGMSNKSSS
ncbi:MAG TPA: hypothetical protein VK489_16075 [Ferruginibacter sp.]|nr:hypothetical protein [Ferruginibacter sp.]